jgi:TRAP-type C4-dicarboxylate transport system permease small subunit
MLVSVGMYLPIETTAAIFVGGVIRWMADGAARRRGYNEAQRARVENAGVLTASGLIAGEAVLGLVWAGLQFAPETVRNHLQIFKEPSYLIGLVVLVGLALIMIRLPLSSAGSPDEPAPPVAMM